MAYITREDGERFVVPSYRDVITAKSAGTLKKEMESLSSSYGEYATLQQKSAIQYEVAFSPDFGYLLGETVWYHFKRPLDMIYCEAIPNTTEAMLVIVKDGSVYLDGRFQVDSIPEELVIFLTQQSHFNIFIYGDVPISQIPEDGKFSFEASSVNAFTVLDAPVFETLPLLKIYQLQLVDLVLKSQGIGVFPVKKVAVGVAIAGLLWVMWIYMTAPKTVVREIINKQVNPYQAYYDSLSTPAPDREISTFVQEMGLFLALPGWKVKQLDYTRGRMQSAVLSEGSNISTLQKWCQMNGLTLDVNSKGVIIAKSVPVTNREPPTSIYPIRQVVINVIDYVQSVYPDTKIKFGRYADMGGYLKTTMSVTINGLSPAALALLTNEFKGLPVVLNAITLKSTSDELFTGTVTFDVIGN